MKNKFYITTPIYYVNASPHIGHSYTTIAADTLARFYRRVLGEDKVWFLTGTDEHGQKIQKAAEGAGVPAQEFVDRIVPQFRDLWKKLNITYNDFIRTTELRHTLTVQKALEILFNNGDIYQDKYEGWYCTPCETFWPPSQISETLCPDCKRPLEKINETNYFFKLSKYQDWLISHIEENPLFIRPQMRRNEVLSFLKLNRLTDLCISRPKERLSWGIPLTFSAGHVVYVWFDALINYISAVGKFGGGRYSSNWWEDDVEVIHLVGKDILRQHAIYWPIMLKALSIRQPDSVVAHGWWLIADTKMSKSRGNVVNPLEMAAQFGVDTYRYFLLRDVSFGLDGNFSEDAITKRYNADLANDFGNLVYRTLTMVEKYFSGKVPPAGELDNAGERIFAALKAAGQELSAALSAELDFNFSLALEKLWGLVNLANKYIEDKKPWNLSKAGKTRELEAFIRLLVEVISEVAKDILPFMPATAAAILEQVKADSIVKGKPLFPRIE
ncbi:MAG: methionine--tRNA ligase [Candidatus Omnitrophota bacterium]